MESESKSGRALPKRKLEDAPWNVGHVSECDAAMSGRRLGEGRCAAFHWDRRFYCAPITSLNAAISFLFSSIVPTEMRTHSTKP
jgi:hypothetical protein